MSQIVKSRFLASAISPMSRSSTPVRSAVGDSIRVDLTRSPRWESDRATMDVPSCTRAAGVVPKLFCTSARPKVSRRFGPDQGRQLGAAVAAGCPLDRRLTRRPRPLRACRPQATAPVARRVAESSGPGHAATDLPATGRSSIPPPAEGNWANWGQGRQPGAG